MTIWTTPTPALDWALFLDVDGTLLEFAVDPATVQPPPALLRTLERVAGVLGGALALVSGRPLASLDAMFAPWRPPAAGLHGLERRDARGTITSVPVALGGRARAELAAEVAVHPRLRLEDKGATVAIHYRGAPELATVARSSAERALAAQGPGWQLLEGACVYELKPAGVTKGRAVEAFARELPFAGRRPIYVGDDVTDADGIAAAELLGGHGIAVGTRIEARWRLPDPAATRRWLDELPDAIAAGAPRAVRGSR